MDDKISAEKPVKQTNIGLTIMADNLLKVPEKCLNGIETLSFDENGDTKDNSDNYSLSTTSSGCWSESSSTENLYNLEIGEKYQILTNKDNNNARIKPGLSPNGCVVQVSSSGRIKERKRSRNSMLSCDMELFQSPSANIEEGREDSEKGGMNSLTAAQHHDRIV